MLVRGLLASTLCAVLAQAALAQSSFTPVAFGPLGAAPAGTFYASTIDISSDGQSILAVLNTGEQRLITPSQVYTLTGTGTASALSGNGQVLVGGQSGANPQRWRVAAAAGGSIASENFPWPGGPISYGNMIGTNRDGSVGAVTTPGVSVLGPFGRNVAQSAFTAVDIGANAGAYRGVANDVPVVALFGNVPGNPTNYYRWNYQTGVITPITLPAGASAISFVSGASAISSDGGILVGGATIGAPTLPYWFDAAGVGHAVPFLPGATVGSAVCVNGSGTLLGGVMTSPGNVQRAYILSLQDNRMYDLNAIATAAGLLPSGWSLIATQQISDDGSRIFCLARDASGVSQSVILQGNFSVPGPGAAGVLALAGMAVRRRR